MKKLFFSICTLAIAAFSLTTVKDVKEISTSNVEALSLSEYETGYSMLYCLENDNSKCYSYAPNGKKKKYSTGLSIEFFY
jgi:hypothetical protein